MTRDNMELCQADLLCLDAHSHLGNLVFDHSPQDAIRHYEVGLRIGGLSLGNDFTGVLQWGNIDKRHQQTECLVITILNAHRSDHMDKSCASIKTFRFLFEEK